MRVILLAVCLSALAAAVPAAQPARAPAASFSVPVVYKKLPNGLRVVVSENHAIAFGYHLPERFSRDFFALSLLDPLLVSDESAKLYQALVKDKRIAAAVAGGFNYALGNNFDYNGPMLYTFRVGTRCWRPTTSSWSSLATGPRSRTSSPGSRRSHSSISTAR